MNIRDSSKSTASRLVVVLGMHRSGTSSITRALLALGVDLGSDFLPPDQANANGYWENTELHEFNIEMLNALEREWTDLAPLTDREIALLRDLGFETRAIAWLSQNAGRALNFGVKNPRVTGLLPFWKTVFDTCGHRVDYVLAIRNPASVAHSLEKRDRLNREHSHLLWFTHVIASLNVHKSADPTVIDYDRLIQSPDTELQRLADDLDLKIGPEQLDVYRSEFLDGALRHHRHQLDDLSREESCPRIVEEIYLHLLDVASGAERLDREKLSVWSAQTDALEPAFRYLDRLHRHIDRLSQPPSFGESLYHLAYAVYRKLPGRHILKRALRRSA